MRGAIPLLRHIHLWHQNITLSFNEDSSQSSRKGKDDFIILLVTTHSSDTDSREHTRPWHLMDRVNSEKRLMFMSSNQCVPVKILAHCTRVLFSAVRHIYCYYLLLWSVCE
jgi:hypothetical protein